MQSYALTRPPVDSAGFVWAVDKQRLIETFIRALRPFSGTDPVGWPLGRQRATLDRGIWGTRRLLCRRVFAERYAIPDLY